MTRLSKTDRSYKKIDGRLRVNAWTPDGFLSAGFLDLEESGDRDMAAVFRYDHGYLVHPHAYPLDPVNMPLSTRDFASTSQFVTIGAIFDAAPDAWGRKVVQAAIAERLKEANVESASKEGQQMFRQAFLRGADGIGALILTPESLPIAEIPRIISASLNERPSMSELQKAARAAKEFELNGEVSAGLENMLAGSWTIGGARPKAILRNDADLAPAGVSVIAKFPSSRDHLDRGRLEWACLEMAHDMGFNVPKHALIDSDSHGGQSILILERFDRDYTSQTISRLHYASAMSLISYEPQSKLLNTRFDRAMLSWAKLLEITKTVASKPGAASVEMFAHLCLNAALSNTDDHLKNFGFLKSPTDALHYDIAPVFDVSPQASDMHYLHCGDLGQRYTLKECVGQARTLGIAAGAAAAVHDRIMAVLNRRDDYFDMARLSHQERAPAGAWVARGAGSVSTPSSVTSKASVVATELDGNAAPKRTRRTP